MHKLSLANPTGLSMKQRVLLSAGSQMIGQVFGILFAIATLKIITASLGVHGYGIYATALAFVTSFSLFTDFGLTAITGREIAKSPERANEIIGHNMGLKIALCLIALPLIVGLSYLIYPHGASTLKHSIMLMSAYLVFDTIRAVSLSYFTAIVRNDVAAVVGGFQQFSLLVLSGLAALFMHNIYGFVLAFGIANILSAGLSVLIARKFVRLRPTVNLKYWRLNIKMSLSYGIILISNLLYLKADSVMLSIIKSPVEVGLYGIAYSLILAFLLLPGFVMTALIPSMATVKSKDQLTELVEKTLAIMAILAALLVSGGFVVRHNIVIAVSSPAFAAAAVPFAILCLATGFSYLNSVFSYASVSIDKHHRLVYVSLGTLVLNILLNLFMIPHFGLIGAAWATVICEVFSLIAVYIIFSQETQTRVRLLRATYKPILSGLITLGITHYLAFLWNGSSHVLNTLISGVTALVLFSLALFALNGMPEEITQLVTKVRRVLTTGF